MRQQLSQVLCLVEAGHDAGNSACGSCGSDVCARCAFCQRAVDMHKTDLDGKELTSYKLQKDLQFHFDN